MAQGNDAAQAAAELATREGVEPNAEAILRDSLERYPADLKAASLLGENEEATEALDLETVGKVVPGAITFTVRGTEDPQVLVAFDNADGLGVRKCRVPLSEFGGGRKPAARKAPAKKAAPRKRAPRAK